MRIVIDNETAGTVLYQDLTQKGSLCYPISLDDIAAILERSIKNNDEWSSYSYGDIPINCIWHEISIKKRQQMNKAVFFVPSGKRRFSFNNVDYVVPIPNLIFKFTVINNHRSSQQVAVIKTSDLATDTLYGMRILCIEEKTILYKWPYSNVSESSDICFGSKSHGDIKCFNDLVNIPEIFMSSIMTDHYFKSNSQTYSEFLSALNGKDVFDENELLPLKQNYENWRK